MNIKSALKWATQQLNDLSDSARLDSEVLLCHTLNKDRSYLYTWPEKILSNELQQQFKNTIATRKSGNPIAYILGYKDFWSLTFNVTTDTLIPRPETELLVEQVLKLVPKNNKSSILDLGTGSGAIALAVASERKQCDICATDKSALALEVAIKNAHLNGITNISFIKSDWFDSLAGKKFNIIISNPPYVKTHDPLLLQGDVQFEPSSALKSGIDGLDDIRLIINSTSSYLLNDGWLLLEHGFEQRESVQQIFKQKNFKNISTVNDLSGHPRVTFGQY